MRSMAGMLAWTSAGGWHKGWQGQRTAAQCAACRPPCTPHAGRRTFSAVGCARAIGRGPLLVEKAWWDMWADAWAGRVVRMGAGAAGCNGSRVRGEPGRQETRMCSLLPSPPGSALRSRTPPSPMHANSYSQPSYPGQSHLWQTQIRACWQQPQTAPGPVTAACPAHRLSWRCCWLHPTAGRGLRRPHRPLATARFGKEVREIVVQAFWCQLVSPSLSPGDAGVQRSADRPGVAKRWQGWG